ncbi:MAG: ribosomal protein S18-alanine N-acetyltransferase [Magnetococcales bacterium]|nr:ribosomal protein S18-alanine N-acetyltransferase [Magnetococcales bacterium]
MIVDDIPHVASLDQAISFHPWSLAMFQEELTLGSYCRVAVATTDGIEGYLLARLLWDEWHLLAVGVAPEKRGLGLARTLMTDWLNHTLTTPSRTAFLEVGTSNRAAEHLYLSLGFIPIGRRKNYYSGPLGNEDAIVMARPIQRIGSLHDTPQNPTSIPF